MKKQKQTTLNKSIKPNKFTKKHKKEPLEVDSISSEEELIISDSESNKNNKLEKEVNDYYKSLGFSGKFDEEGKGEDDAVEDNDALDEEGDAYDKKNTKQNFNLEEEESFDKKHLKKFLIPPNPLWYSSKIQPTKPQFKPTKISPEESTKIISLLQEKAKSLIQKESQTYTSLKSHSSDYKFSQQILKSGTLSDKISALCLLTQESPVHNLSNLETLLGLAKKTRREAIMAIDGLKDVFLGVGGGVIPTERKLKFFREQDLDSLISLVASSKEYNKAPYEIPQNLLTKPLQQQIVLFYTEDFIKNSYIEFISLLNQYSKDSIKINKLKMVNYAFELLVCKTEQEKTLLSFLVNKLGDVELSSKVSYLLLKLLEKHPGMKLAVIKEVEGFVMKEDTQNSGKDGKSKDRDREKYVGYNTLNQIIFTTSKIDVFCARYLVHMYMRLFDNHDSTNSTTELKNQKNHKKFLQDSNSKIINAALVGINRAIPFASHTLPSDISGIKVPASQKYLLVEDILPVYEEKIEGMFRVANAGGLGVGVQAMNYVFLLLFGNSTGSGIGGDVTVTGREFSEKLVSRYFRCLYSMILSSGLSNSSTSAKSAFLHLIYKSLIKDTDSNRIIAFIKRLLQVCLCADVAFVCGCLVVISEVIQIKSKRDKKKNSDGKMDKKKKGDRGFSGGKGMSEFEKCVKTSKGFYLNRFGGDDEEKYVDVDDGKSDLDKKERDEIKEERDEIKEEIKVNESEEIEKESIEVNDKLTEYDPLARSPEYSKAETESLWELTLLANHYHPTVSLFASTLLYQSKGQEIATNAIRYPSDPLQDFANTRFLDRFVFKNPKQNQKSTQKENNEPYSKLLRKTVPMDRTKDLPVSSLEWRQKMENSSVPVDEEFYAPYFMKREKRKRSDEDDGLSEGEIEGAILGGLRDDEFGEDEDDELEGLDEEMGMSEEMDDEMLEEDGLENAFEGEDDGFESVGGEESD